MDTKDIDDILYNYIEFFFPKQDLESMMKIKALSYENWMETVYNLYSVKPNSGDKRFHYNIMHTDEYMKIMKILTEINTIYTTTDGTKTTDEKKQDTRMKIEEIEKLYESLYYYDEVYVFAHHVFNNIRKLPNFGIDIQRGGKGGDISLEQFKQIIREKIKMLDL